MRRGSMSSGSYLILAGALALILAGCSGRSENAGTPPTADEVTASATAAPLGSATAAPSGSSTAAAGAASTPIFSLPSASSTAAAAAGTPLSQQQLDQLALTATDLPPGFQVTGSGPGGPELGRDVLASYQVEFQQRDVTSTQGLQQTIVIIDLLGQYKDANGALGGIRAVNVQSLNQLLGSVNLTAESASIPPIGDDSSAFHFSGDTNGSSVGGYLILFRHGSIAALVLTASVKGSESLPQTVDLAQKQAQKLSTVH